MTPPIRIRRKDIVPLLRSNGIGLVDYSAAAGPQVVHALQGGGKGLGGRHIEATWCGIDRSKPTWAHVRLTDATPTCSSCKRNLKAAARSWRTA